MDLRNFFNSAEALKLGLWIGRHTPPRLGHALANGFTAILASRKESSMYRTVRSNISTVLGPDATEAQIERTVKGVFHHVGQVYFDFYHTYALGRQALVDSVDLSPHVTYYMDQLKAAKRGAVIVGSHMSNFDMGALSLAHRGYKVTALAFANPTSGYDMQNQIRQEAGIDWLPIDVSLLRRAMTILRSGGLIVTGVDRPDPFGGGEMIDFFGRPARLPVGHVRLALQTGVPIGIVAVEYRESDRRYVVHLPTLIEMEHVGDKQENVQHNARRVLNVIEKVIAAHPDQWLMFYPVWEEGLARGKSEQGAVNSEQLAVNSEQSAGSSEQSAGSSEQSAGSSGQ